MEVEATPKSESLPPTGFHEDSPTPTQEIESALNHTIASALDFANWDEGTGWQGLEKARRYLTKSLEKQDRLVGSVRKHVLQELRSFPNHPDNAGVFQVKEKDLRFARQSILISGNTTAVRGASVAHEGMAASLVSIGVCLTKYDGHFRSWRNVFMRHECDIRSDNPVAEIKAILNQRARRSRMGPAARGSDTLSKLMRRAFQSAAERKSLLEKCNSRWRMGHGVPAPYELLSGSGSMGLIDHILPVLEDLLINEKRWVFIPSSMSNLAFMTLAAALRPHELAIIQKAKPTFDAMLDMSHLGPTYHANVREFVDKAGDQIIIGGFRATKFAPPQLFFAHAEYAIGAGLVAMADAELQPHRGYPLLLELAGLSCKTSLGVDAFQGMVESTYAAAHAVRYDLAEN